MKTKTKIPVLLLCHGRAHTTKPCTPSNDISCCPTSEIDFKDKTLKLTLLDKDPQAKPHILHDFRKKLVNTKLKSQFDIITTMCCDTDMFYDEKQDSIVKQCFINIVKLLSSNGVFVMPQYYWLNKKILNQIKEHLQLIKKYKSDYDIFYIFTKL